MTEIQQDTQRPQDRSVSVSQSATGVPTVPAILRGRNVIRMHLKTLTNSPGVYRMMDGNGQVLYVGKAKNLKKRVASYANQKGLTTRITGMVAATVDMEFITTHTEVEALLLESNLIKKLKPRYNILLRDDKAFPYILVTGDHEWAQITKHRGARNRRGEYFGPFASAGSVNQTINTLQRAFPLRSCTDSIFSTRTRPCLQYQIRRCSAPCVGKISHEAYEQIVDEARNFLSGRSHRTQQELSTRMQEASSNLEFETAAVYRDRIRALTQIQAKQGINIPTLGEADVIAAYQDAGQACIQVFFFRSGQNYGNRAYFPIHAKSDTIEEILTAFIGQFYSDKMPPAVLLTSHEINGRTIVEEALAVRADRRVNVQVPRRGAKRQLMEHAVNNSREALARRLAESASQRRLLEGVAHIFGLEAPPERIEVYDNSHIRGNAALGGMIVAGAEGLIKNQYRKFNIKQKDLTPGNDYGMMTEVLTRRFARLLREDEARKSQHWPDLVLIDGGIGHMHTAQHVFADLGITDVGLAAIAKGPHRNAGQETFHVQGKEAFSLEPNDPVLYFLQRLRDEAHRYAIGSHRAKRSKKISRSTLDEISGIGAKRKRALLHHFGSARSVEQAGLADLEAVEGISDRVAKAIYDHFHPED
jgi:excinuclease ABC subunit C